MSSIYFYPKSDPQLDKSSNPYIFYFENSLLKNHNIVNKTINKKGVLDLFKYLFISDIFLFNWIENLASRKLGKLQVSAFIVFLFGAKILGKKIVWILHNIYSHDTKNNGWTNFMFCLMMKHSNLILTHSQSGIDFANINYPKFSSKIKYLIHPVQEAIPVISDSQKKYDLLIWGVILPYKGISQFLEFAKCSNDWSLIKILIVGKCFDNAYKQLLNKYLSENVIHFDYYYDIKEISRLANQSKFILFTYRSGSVLSSGSLMDSIRMGSNIIGPNFGAFKDLSSYGFMHLYNDFNEIINILKNKEIELESNSREIQNFCLENSWEFFMEKVDIELKRILE
jgi:beta-1,4-mannosyltransferase